MVKASNVRALRPLDGYVARMELGEVICRGRHRHNWPSDTLRPGQPLPTGIDTIRQHDGSFQVTEWCVDCGKECTWTTLPKGVFDVNVIRRYKNPERWVTIPREVEYTPRDLRAAHIAMVRDTLFGRGGRKSS